MSIISPVALPYVAGATTSESTSGLSGSLGIGGLTMFNRNIIIPNNSVVYSVGLYCSASKGTGQKIKIGQRTGAGIFTIVLDMPVTHPGGSVFVDYVLPSPLPIPSSGNFYVGSYYVSNDVCTGSGPARSYISGDQTGSSISGFTEDATNAPVVRFTLGV